MNYIISFVTVAAAAAVMLAVSSLPVNGFMFARRKGGPSGKIAGVGPIGTIFQSRGRPMESRLLLSPDDLTNYMAKAHEEKIRALKDIEDKKNVEILVSLLLSAQRIQSMVDTEGCLRFVRATHNLPF